MLNNRLPVHVQSTVRFRIRPETWKKYVHIQVEGGKGGHQIRQRRGVRRFKFMHCQCEVNIDQGTWPALPLLRNLSVHMRVLTTRSHENAMRWGGVSIEHWGLDNQTSE